MYSGIFLNTLDCFKTDVLSFMFPNSTMIGLELLVLCFFSLLVDTVLMFDKFRLLRILFTVSLLLVDSSGEGSRNQILQCY